MIQPKNQHTITLVILYTTLDQVSPRLKPKDVHRLQTSVDPQPPSHVRLNSGLQASFSQPWTFLPQTLIHVSLVTWTSFTSPLTKGCLLQRLARSFGEESIDENHFKGQKATVSDKVFPANIGKADGVDKCRKELSTARKQLKDGDATGALGIGPYLHQVCCQPLSE